MTSRGVGLGFERGRDVRLSKGRLDGFVALYVVFRQRRGVRETRLLRGFEPRVDELGARPDRLGEVGVFRVAR